MTRWCPGCEKNRAPQFWATSGQRTCDTCRRKARSASAHRSRVKATYGLSPEDYAALLLHQGGRCAICRGKRGYRLNVDHDHKTGLVRGLLCRRCNKVLAAVGDALELVSQLYRYLVKPPAEELGIVARAAPQDSTPPED